MKKIIIFTPLTLIIIAIMGFMSYNKSTYINLPVTEFGVIDVPKFNGWIGGATNAVNVFVKPADSPNFVGDNWPVSESNFDRQDFFRWSQQMFLWILSPVPSDGSYGSCSGLVLNSKEFYDFDKNNQTYVKHLCSTDPSTSKGNVNMGNTMSFDVKGAQNGIHNLPLFFEEGTDKVYDIDKTPKSENGYPMVFDEKKNKVEVGTIKVDKTMPIFIDRSGKVIDKARLILSPSLNAKTTIQQFQIGEKIVNIGFSGSFLPIVIIPSQIQTGGSNALMNRHGSLVYYNIMVNDVFVAFSQMVKDHVISDKSLFPTTLEDEDNYDENGVNIPRIGLNTIKNYGATHGIPIVDTGNRVLALELKTSWVETTTNLPNSNNYVKINAKVPNYIPNPSLPGGWIRSGMRSTTLALVGMHVVGSVLGHPEMIWSTFEHINNCPNPQIDAITGTPSTGFIFNDGAAGTANVSHIQGFNNLSGANGFPISASKTVRNMPFGWAGIPGQAGATGNPVDVLPVGDSNAQLANLYSDARSRLLPNDVRRNYFQVGAMWNSPFTNPLSGDTDNHIAGTVRLSNATMETYTQATSSSTTGTTGAGLNCFSCHNRGTDDFGNYEAPPAPGIKELSHVFKRNVAP